MRTTYLTRILLLIPVFIASGCGPSDITITKKTSYADLVVIYNAEIETLERLENKRKSLIADFFSQAQEKAFRSAVNSIESGGAQRVPSNPNQALDQAVAAAELQAELQSGLVDTLGLSSSPKDEKNFPEELKSKLAELDAEIADQQQRVKRAKEDRDSAQPK
jgi:hypothetical protein